MSKRIVTMHYEQGSGTHPAINVRVYGIALDAEQVAQTFGCDEDTAQHALGYAWDANVEAFRDAMQVECKEIYPDAKMYSKGRSGGWLAVHGLKDVESWNAVDLSKWAKLERITRENVRYFSSAEALLDVIRINEWAQAREAVNA